MSARNRLNSLSLAAVFALALLGGVSPAAAQKVFPDRSVTLVLPYAPGGTVDIQARLLAQGLTGKLGHAVIVRNMPGATGAIATDFVARAPEEVVERLPHDGFELAGHARQGDEAGAVALEEHGRGPASC